MTDDSRCWFPWTSARVLLFGVPSARSKFVSDIFSATLSNDIYMAPALNGMATISNKANSFSIQWYTHRKLDFVARTVALISSLQCLPYLFGNATCLPRTLVLWPVIKAGNHFLIESTARSTHAHPLYICLSFFLSLTLTARECLCVCVYYVVAAFSGLLPGCIVLIELPFIWGQRTLRA